MEAAELDGANAWQRFRNVTVPGIRSSIVVVVTTIAIGSLKIYDIVAVMTGGRNNTTVLAFEMVNQQQRFQSYGHAAALAVVLFIFVHPAHRVQRASRSGSRGRSDDRRQSIEPVADARTGPPGRARHPQAREDGAASA